jgi:hypothetical protein
MDATFYGRVRSELRGRLTGQQATSGPKLVITPSIMKYDVTNAELAL